MLANQHISRNRKGNAMRPVNLSYLMNITGEDLFSVYENALSGRRIPQRIRRADQIALRSLLKTLFRAGLTDLSCYDGFFFSYVIERMGKEFDLVKLGKNRTAVLNIELKSQMIEEEKIEKQLLQNRYYLTMIAQKVFSFTYISSAKRFYAISQETGTLIPVRPEDLIGTMRQFTDYYEQDITPLFRISEFLISPITTPEPFLERRYFLTNQQQQFRKEILEMAKHPESCGFIGITGSPGTGKTLLLYDIARELSGWYRVLVLHCARLSEGHRKLREALPSLAVASIRDVTGEFLSENRWDIILVDESQRLYQESFDLLVKHAEKNRVPAVFCYDPSQVLTVSERERNIAGQIEKLAGEHIFTLSSRLRTNAEIASFVSAFFDRRKQTRKYDYDNILLLYAPSEEDTDRMRRHLEREGYIYIDFSGQGARSEAVLDTHDIIGLEFDRVVVSVGKEFYYDKTGCLRTHAHGNPNYLYDRMLFQNISRTREKLCIIIADNLRLFKEAASITAPAPDHTSAARAL